MGDDRSRIVQIGPFWVWNKVTEVEISKIDQSEWYQFDDQWKPDAH
jgi:hypothetical protein